MFQAEGVAYINGPLLEKYIGKPQTVIVMCIIYMLQRSMYLGNIPGWEWEHNKE